MVIWVKGKRVLKSYNWSMHSCFLPNVVFSLLSIMVIIESWYRVEHEDWPIFFIGSVSIRDTLCSPCQKSIFSTVLFKNLLQLKERKEGKERKIKERMEAGRKEKKGGK